MDGKPKVLILHNEYLQPGGEDLVLANERQLLEAHDHKVEVRTRSNTEIGGAFSKLKVAWQLPYSDEGRHWAARQIAEVGPNVVHVHNTFPLLTPAVYDACADAGVPVVLTLHNYRYICANGLFLRDGGPCEDCLGASPYQAVTHRCYRDSKLGSLSLARLIAHHQKRGTWRSKVNRFVALTEFARSKFVAAGFPQEKVAVKPNFVASTEADEAAVGAPRAGALFVGRLAAEKGIATMMQAWRSLDVPLRVLGDGPLAGLVKGFGNPAVEPLGWRSSDEVADEMRRAGFLVMPSEWYEGFPLTLVEAFSRGLPVLASGIGGMAEVVEDGVTGLHFAPGDVGDIVEKVAWAAGHPDEMRRMGENARRAYERLYSAEANYDMLQAIYDAAVEDRKLQTGG